MEASPTGRFGKLGEDDLASIMPEAFNELSHRGIESHRCSRD
jgi:hypothetical protein